MRQLPRAMQRREGGGKFSNSKPALSSVKSCSDVGGSVGGSTKFSKTSSRWQNGE